MDANELAGLIIGLDVRRAYALETALAYTKSSGHTRVNPTSIRLPEEMMEEGFMLIGQMHGHLRSIAKPGKPFTFVLRDVTNVVWWLLSGLTEERVAMEEARLLIETVCLADWAGDAGRLNLFLESAANLGVVGAAALAENIG